MFLRFTHCLVIKFNLKWLCWLTKIKCYQIIYMFIDGKKMSQGKLLVWFHNKYWNYPTILLWCQSETRPNPDKKYIVDPNPIQKIFRWPETRLQSDAEKEGKIYCWYCVLFLNKCWNYPMELKSASMLHSSMHGSYYTHNCLMSISSLMQTR